jgi:hypothetical protein
MFNVLSLERARFNSIEKGTERGGLTAMKEIVNLALPRIIETTVLVLHGNDGYRRAFAALMVLNQL